MGNSFVSEDHPRGNPHNAGQFRAKENSGPAALTDGVRTVLSGELARSRYVRDEHLDELLIRFRQRVERGAPNFIPDYAGVALVRRIRVRSGAQTPAMKDVETGRIDATRLIQELEAVSEADPLEVEVARHWLTQGKWV